MTSLQAHHIQLLEIARIRRVHLGLLVLMPALSDCTGGVSQKCLLTHLGVLTELLGLSEGELFVRELAGGRLAPAYVVLH